MQCGGIFSFGYCIDSILQLQTPDAKEKQKSNKYVSEKKLVTDHIVFHFLLCMINRFFLIIDINVPTLYARMNYNINQQIKITYKIKISKP